MQIQNKSVLTDHKNRITLVNEQHDQMLADLAAQEPQPMTVEQNTTGAPLDLGNGVVVMPDDYYGDDGTGQTIVVAATDIGVNGAWEQA